MYSRHLEPGAASTQKRDFVGAAMLVGMSAINIAFLLLVRQLGIADDSIPMIEKVSMGISGALALGFGAMAVHALVKNKGR